MKLLSNEKLFLITKIMDSYIISDPYQKESIMVGRFDKLYDMDVEALKHLAKIRKINIKELDSIIT